MLVELSLNNSPSLKANGKIFQDDHIYRSGKYKDEGCTMCLKPHKIAW